jgi:hypothetical protein
MSRAQVKTMLISFFHHKDCSLWVSWTWSNSELALSFGDTGKVTWGCSSEKNWTLAWRLDLASWQRPCSWRARCPGVFD